MKHKNLIFITAVCFLLPFQLSSKSIKKNNAEMPLYKNASAQIEDRINDLLARMTIDEKAGQLNQLNAGVLTGPKSAEQSSQSKLQMVREGKVGSFLNLTGVADTREIQKIAVEQSRLGIPLLFALDVIHGYKTIFPIPLAEACSWDLKQIEKNQAVAADEASAAGIHWTFAPMCDISNDPRWGRVMEGAGEDPVLGAMITAARVKGFQGELKTNKNIMACVKHFAAYGAVEAGKEYNHVDVSRFALWNKYLPTYKAGIDAGAATIMNSFNVFEGVPSTGNKYLSIDVLRYKLKFNGFNISDWNTYTEMIYHGFAADEKDALEKALNAGGQMEMNSATVIKYLPQLLSEGLVSMQTINDAVKKVLYYKFKLGLFDNPYLFCDEAREKATLFNAQNRAEARKAAANSIILLENKNNILPLKQNIKPALIGFYAKSKDDMYDFWIAKGDATQAVSLYEGIQSVYPSVVYADGYDADGRTNETLIRQAVATATNSDVILFNIGLSGKMAGEDRSLADIKVPLGQRQLLDALKATGKPVIVLISSGRPLVLTQIAGKADAMLQCWILGAETGNAVADVLTGKVNPSAKTVMSFPYDEGQIPVYYNYFNTGRPHSVEPGGAWFSRYRDIPNKPLFPFGFGLSYTTFSYSDLKVDKTQFSRKDSLNISVKVKNTGNYEGTEIVQLYIQDPVASFIRPVKEFKKFEKIVLMPNAEMQVNFKLSAHELGFYDMDGNWILEPGIFHLMIGTNSDEVSKTTVKLLN